MTKITKYFQFKYVLTIAFILLFSQPLMAVTIFDESVRTKIEFADLGVNSIGDFGQRSFEQQGFFLETFWEYSDKSLYTIGGFDEGGLHGQLVGESAACNGRDWGYSDEWLPTVVDKLGYRKGDKKTGEYGLVLNQLDAELGDKFDIDQDTGEEWFLQLNNFVRTDIYATGTPEYPDSYTGERIFEVLDTNQYGIANSPYMIALNITQDMENVNLLNASTDIHGNNTDFLLNVKAGSMVLFWEDGVDRKILPSDSFYYSDWDWNDMVVVVTPEEHLSSIPEPSTVILFTIGMVGLLGARIRMKGKN